MEALLHRAIAQHAPTRAVWITPELVAEREGEWPHARRATGFAPARLTSEPPGREARGRPLWIGSSLPSAGVWCVFRSNPIGRFGGIRSAVSVESDRSFRSNPITLRGGGAAA